MTSARAAAMPARMTAEQLLELPDDGYRHELVQGELQTLAPAGGQHGQIALTIGGLVWNHVRQHGPGALLRRRDRLRSPS